MAPRPGMSAAAAVMVMVMVMRHLRVPTLADQPDQAERERARERPDEWPIMRQVWRNLGFFHWRVDAGAVARLLPPGLTVDTFDGAAYVGVVPFTIPMSRIAGLGLPIVPHFHEANVRTYVHRAGRDPGVWFFSLDAASRLAVAGARLGFGLPYFYARMSLRVTGDATRPNISYQSRRALPVARRAVPVDDAVANLEADYAPTGPAHGASPGSLEFFMIERYRLYAGSGRRLTSARVFHAPYPVQSATGDIRETLTAAAGLPPRSDVLPLTHYAQEVDVEIYRPHRVRD